MLLTISVLTGIAAIGIFAAVRARHRNRNLVIGATIVAVIVAFTLLVARNPALLR